MEICKRHKLIIMVLAIIAVCVLPKSAAAIEILEEETSILMLNLDDIPEPEDKVIPQPEEKTVPAQDIDIDPQTTESDQKYINFQLAGQCWQEPVDFSAHEVPLIPLRQLAQKVGAQVIWQKESGALFFVRGEWMAVFHPQLKFVYTARMEGGNIVWEKRESEDKPVISENGCYLSSPLLAYLGMQAFWDENFQVLNIVLDEEIYSSEEKTLSYLNVWSLIKEDLCGEKAKVPQLVGQYRTYFDPELKNRTLNLKRASSAVDGTILAPGEIFSFNEIVGPRTPQNGYTKAVIFASGNESYDYGGGVCQVASTIYNAALEAGFVILERHRHSLPVSYVPSGKDATVAYGYKDLRFTNDAQQSITIRCLIDGNMLSVQFWG